jgi:hypothetical protein
VQWRNVTVKGRLEVRKVGEKPRGGPRGLHISRNVGLTRASENVVRQSALWWLAGLHILQQDFASLCDMSAALHVEHLRSLVWLALGWVFDSTISVALPITPFSVWSLGLEHRSDQSIRFLLPYNVCSFRRRRRHSRDDHGLRKRVR